MLPRTQAVPSVAPQGRHKWLQHSLTAAEKPISDTSAMHMCVYKGTAHKSDDDSSLLQLKLVLSSHQNQLDGRKPCHCVCLLRPYSMCTLYTAAAQHMQCCITHCSVRLSDICILQHLKYCKVCDNSRYAAMC